MKIAICEDEPKDQIILCNLLQTYLKSNGYNFQVSVFKNGDELLAAFKEGCFRLLFLDVLMPGDNGVAVAGKIRELDMNIPIIFITSSKDYAVESYKVNALHYLIKPISQENLKEALRRCIDTLEASMQYLEIVAERELVRVYLKDILSAEAFGNLICIHTQKGEFSTYIPLDLLLSKMNDSFLRCHRSYIVNMDYIKKVNGKEFVLTDNQRIPIRTNGCSKVLHQYSRYLVEAVRR